MQIGAVRQGQLRFAVFDPALHSLVIVIDARVGDQVIDPVHLHGDFLAHRDLAPNYGITKHAVVFGNGSV